ncbi:MAG TPA: hypothetical protein DIW82_06230 [Corynebacterium nuruki]|uniref:VOC domain-containing protein n=1 Tax=Corynebacterium nuruki TaxID=1032851 RepID=A0A3D4SZ89_9CORY|nr:hypothetical protein [Corynebacterium nuruki]
MKFRQIDLPVDDPSGWTSWMARELGLPPHPVMPDAVVVGWSTLRFRYMPSADSAADAGGAGTAATGGAAAGGAAGPAGTAGAAEPEVKRGHHIAFAIPTGTVDDYAAAFGTDIVDRPGGPFAMRSVYLTGPENSVLELVEHEHRPADVGVPTGATGAAGAAGAGPQLLGVVEVGLGVPDVRAAGDALAAHYGDRLPHGFGDPDRRIIAAYGDIDGAVILTVDDRPWFPTEDTFPVTTRPRILVAA